MKEKKKRLCENTYSRFSPGKIGFRVIFPGGNSTILPFFSVVNSTMKNLHSHFFPGGKLQGGKLISDSNKNNFCPTLSVILSSLPNWSVSVALRCQPNWPLCQQKVLTELVSQS